MMYIAHLQLALSVCVDRAGIPTFRVTFNSSPVGGWSTFHYELLRIYGGICTHNVLWWFEGTWMLRLSHQLSDVDLLLVSVVYQKIIIGLVCRFGRRVFCVSHLLRSRRTSQSQTQLYFHCHQGRLSCCSSSSSCALASWDRVVRRRAWARRTCSTTERRGSTCTCLGSGCEGNWFPWWYVCCAPRSSCRVSWIEGCFLSFIYCSMDELLRFAGKFQIPSDTLDIHFKRMGIVGWRHDCVILGRGFDFVMQATSIVYLMQDHGDRFVLQC